MRTPNDFGTQGERPVHPELLDWLAEQLIAGGWRLKPLHKQIVMSAAYRQQVSSAAELADDRSGCPVLFSPPAAAGGREPCATRSWRSAAAWI